VGSAPRSVVTLLCLPQLAPASEEPDRRFVGICGVLDLDADARCGERIRWMRVALRHRVSDGSRVLAPPVMLGHVCLSHH
jgi:hypothetical protein